MEERKLLDMTMEDGQNFSVYMLNEDCDDATLLYIERDMNHYYTYTSDNLNDFALNFFKDENCIIRFNYVSDDAIDYLRIVENLDCLHEKEKLLIRVLLDGYLRGECKL